MADSGQTPDTTNTNGSSSRSDIISRRTPSSMNQAPSTRSGGIHAPARVPNHVSAQIPQPGESVLPLTARGRQSRTNSVSIPKVAPSRVSSGSLPPAVSGTPNRPGDSKLPSITPSSQSLAGTPKVPNRPASGIVPAPSQANPAVSPSAANRSSQTAAPAANRSSQTAAPAANRSSQTAAPAANRSSQTAAPAANRSSQTAAPAANRSSQTAAPAANRSSQTSAPTANKSGESSAPAANKSGEVDKPEDAKQAEGNTLPVGTRIDEKYEIIGVLGTGGFATVYRAHHLMIDRDVALKVMDIQKGVDPSYKDRFFREAKIASKIQHNNVVSIYDIGVIAQTQQPYIAMEMLVGHDLSHELEKNGPLSPKRAFTLFRPVLDALAEGHRQGIVHKDLKPENLFLLDPGGPHESMKVLDFGVARIDSTEVAKLTSAGQLLGTPRYLAPEYIKSQLVTPAIDVYQMALIFSEALIGIPAVSGDPYSAMMHHCQGDLRIADCLLEGEVGQVFCKAIALDNNERYQNCEELAHALDTIERFFESDVPIVGGDTQAKSDRHTSSKVIVATGNVKPIVTSSLTEAIKITPKKKNNLPLLIILFIVIAAIIAIVAVAMSKKAQDSAQSPETPAVVQAPPVPQEPEKLTFEFETVPEGAQVMLEGVEVCKTPCSKEFKKDETNKISFVLEGYKPSEAILNETTHTLKHGKIFAELSQMAKPKISFTINVTPAEAKTMLYAEDGIPRRCNKGECKYELDPNTMQEATLTLTAQGYNDQTITIKESDATEVNVELVKSRAKTQPKNPTTPTTPGTNPAPAPTQPVQEQKPGFKFM